LHGSPDNVTVSEKPNNNKSKEKAKEKTK